MIVYTGNDLSSLWCLLNLHKFSGLFFNWQRKWTNYKRMVNTILSKQIVGRKQKNTFKMIGQWCSMALSLVSWHPSSNYKFWHRTPWQLTNSSSYSSQANNWCIDNRKVDSSRNVFDEWLSRNNYYFINKNAQKHRMTVRVHFIPPLISDVQEMVHNDIMRIMMIIDEIGSHHLTFVYEGNIIVVAVVAFVPFVAVVDSVEFVWCLVVMHNLTPNRNKLFDVFFFSSTNHKYDISNDLFNKS